MRKTISCPIHIFIYRILKQKAEGRIYISFDCVREILHRKLYAFPKPIHYETLKKMEEEGLIKRHGNSRNILYELTGGNIDKTINQYVDII